MRIAKCCVAGVVHFILSALSYQATADASQLIIGGKSADIGTIIIISPKSTDTSLRLRSSLLNTISLYQTPPKTALILSNWAPAHTMPDLPELS